jgi:poly(beta-D-mannuronate) lyase
VRTDSVVLWLGADFVFVNVGPAVCAQQLGVCGRRMTARLAILPAVFAMECLQFLIVFVALFSFLPAPSAPALISPWQTNPARLNDVDYRCVPLPPISQDLLVTKGLGKSDLSDAVKDAGYPESDAALHDLTARTVAAADAFRDTGSRPAARCAITLLVEAAKDHPMAGYVATKDAAQEQNMALRSLAIAYLKVRDSGVATADEAGLINSWFEQIVDQERKQLENGPCGENICVASGHHGIGVAMAAAAVAIANNDRKLFGWSVKQYHAAVKQIDDRGMLHYDTHGPYALKFNLLSAACLVQIAEFAEINGIALYDYDHGRIHLLVHTVSRGLVDSSPYAAATNTTQRMSKKLEPWQITWAVAYDRRFPDDVITSLLDQVGRSGADLWGGEPVMTMEQ